MLLGLTGSIACGKSTVSALLQQEHQFGVVDFDAVSHFVMRPGGAAYAPVVALFGKDICNAEPPFAIDRKRLGEIVFHNGRLKGLLERAVQPAIRKEVVRRILWLWIRGYSTVVLDAALLFEAKLNRFCYSTLCVDCDEKKQILRLMLRDKCSVELAKTKIQAQMSSAEKRDLATFVLENNGTREDCAERLRRLFPRLRPRYRFLVCFHAVRVGILAGFVFTAIGTLLWFKRKLSYAFL